MGIFDSSWQQVAQMRNQSAPRISTLSDVLGTQRTSQPSTRLSQMDVVRQQAAQRFSDIKLREQAMSIAGGEKPQATGWRGLVGDILENPVTRIAMKPLEVLDIPRRVVVSSLAEITDMFTGADASFNDWIKHVKDPSYGVGTWLTPQQQRKAGKWGARVVGFLGDVVLDPLTYATLGGSQAAKALGATGRNARIVMAQRLIEKGSTVERASEVARKGRAILKADELERLGLDRVGVYFMGKRIAGSGKVAETLMKAPMRARLMLGDTLRGAKVAELFDPQDMAAARRALLRGTAAPESAKDYFNLVTSRNVERAAWTRAMREGEQELTTILKTIPKEELEQVRNTVYRVLENTADEVTDAERKLAEPLTELLKRFWKSVDDDYKLIDSQGGFNEVNRYFPHMRSYDAIKYMRTEGREFVDKLREVFDNPVGTLGVFKHRLEKGDDFFGRVLTDEDIAGGVQRLNTIAREGGFAGDFFETDVVQVMTKYIAQWSEQKGVIAYIKNLWDTGTAQSLLSRQGIDEKAAKEVIDQIAKTSKQFSDDVAKSVQRSGKIAEKVRNLATKQADQLRMEASDVAEYTGSLEARVVDLSTSRDDIAAELGLLANELVSLRGAYNNIFGMDEPLVLGALTDELSVVEAALRDAQSRLGGAQADLGVNMDELQSALEMVGRFDRKMMEIRDRGNVIERVINALIKGEDVDAARRTGNAATRSGKGGRLLKKDADRIVDSFKADIDMRGGNMRDVIKNARLKGFMDENGENAFNKWWKQASGDLPLADKEFANLSVAKVEAIVASATRGEATIHEMRLASMWILARQHWLDGGVYDDNFSALLGRMLGEEGSLAQAALADSWYKNFAQNERDLNRWARVDRIYDNLNYVTDEVERSAREYAAARRLLTRIDIAFQSTRQADVVLSQDQLMDYLVGEFEPLQRVFADFLGEEVDPRLGATIEDLMMPTGVTGEVDEAVANLPKKGRKKGADRSSGSADSGVKTITAGEFRDVLRRYVDNATDQYWNFEVATKGDVSLLLQKNRKVAGEIDTAMEIAAGAGAGGGKIVRFERTGATAFDKPETSFDFYDLSEDIDALIYDDNFTQDAFEALLGERLGGFRQITAAMRADLEKIRIIDKNGRKMRNEVDRIRDTLREDLSHLWFLGAVNERMDKVARSLAPYGLVPTEGMMRKVVNSVASSKVVELRATASTAQNVMITLATIEEKVAAATTGRARDADMTREIIKKELGALMGRDPNATAFLYRFGGTASAKDMRKKWIALGGASGSGERRTVNQQRRAVGLTAISKQEKEAAGVRNKINALRAAGKKRIDAIETPHGVTRNRARVLRREQVDKINAEVGQQVAPLERQYKEMTDSINAARVAAEQNTGFSEIVTATKDLEKRRKKFIKNELVPWWQKITGDDRIPTTGELDTFLKNYADAGSHWDDANSTIAQQMRWVRYVNERVQRGNRSTFRMTAWLNQASDPFVNAAEIILSPHSRQNLPSSYANWLGDYANYAELLPARVAEASGAKNRWGFLRDLELNQRAYERDREGYTAARAAEEAASRSEELQVSRQRAVAGELPAGKTLFGDRGALARRARKAQALHQEMMDSPLYATAVQRKGEDEILRVLAQFDMSKNRTVLTMRAARDIARETVDLGGIVFWQANDESVSPIQLTSKWFADGENPTDGYYFVFDPNDPKLPSPAVGTIQQAAGTGSVVGAPSPQQAAKIENARKQIDRIVSDSNARIRAAQRAFDAAQQAERDAKKLARRSRATAEARVKQIEDRIARLKAAKKINKERIAAEEKKLVQASKDLAELVARDEAPRKVANAVRDWQMAVDLRNRGRHRIVPASTQLTYDNVPIRFTPEELRALWLYGYDADEVAKTIKALEGRMGFLTRERNILSDRRDDIAAETIARYTEDSFVADNPLIQEGQQFWRQQADAAVERRRPAESRAAARGKNIDGSIKETQTLLDAARLDRAAADPAVRAAALQKVVWIRQAIKDGKTSLNDMQRGMASSANVGVATDIVDKYQYLDSLWDGSEEQQFLDELDRIAESAEYAFAQRKMQNADDARMLAQTARAMQADAENRLARGYYNAKGEWQEPSYRRLLATTSDAQTKIAKMAEAVGQGGGDPEAAAKAFNEIFQQGMNEVAEGTQTLEQVFKNVAAAGKAATPPDVPLVGRAEEAAARAAASRARYDNRARNLQRTIAQNFADSVNAAVEVQRLTKQATQLTETINARRSRFTIWRDRELQEEIGPMLRDVQGGYDKVARRLAHAEMSLNEARLLRDDAWDQLSLPVLEQKIANVETMLAALPNGGQNLQEIQTFLAESKLLLETIAANGGKVDHLTKVLVGEQQKIYDLLARQQDMAMSFGGFDITQAVGELEKGWTALSAIGLPNVVVRDEVWGMMKNMKRLNQPLFSRELAKFLGGYTQFFKAYATLSPGFHVRNALSNSFMLVAAGSDVRLFRRSFPLAKGFLEASRNNTLEDFYKVMNPAERELFDAVLRATDAAGGGRTTEALAGFMPKRNVLKNNRALRTSSDVGGAVEFTSRFMLSYDTIVRGMQVAAKNGQNFTPMELFGTAAERTKRFLIDYVDRGIADETIQNIVPFWMWMSRNLPLQLINQWQNPRAYAMYGSMMRNIGLNDDEDIVPSWLKESGAAKVAENWYLAPDLGFNRLKEQTAEMADPIRMLSYVNPILRVPLELTGDRKFYNSVPFRDKPQEVTGGPAQPLIELLLGLAGQTQRTATGETVTSDKANYALMNLLPTLSQAERLVPATEGYQSRQLGSWLSYAGVPLRQVTPQMRESEMARREAQIRELARAAQMLGYTP